MIRVVRLPEHPKWQSPKEWIELVDDNGNGITTGTIYPPETLKEHFGAGEHDPILYGIYRMLWLHRIYKNARGQEVTRG